LLLALSKEWFDPACRDRNTLCGVPLASIVVYGTGDVLDWNKNRSTGTKSLSFLVFAGDCCVALKFLFPFFPFLSLVV